MKVNTSRRLNEVTVRPSAVEDLPRLADLRWALCSDDGETQPPIDNTHFTERFIQRMTAFDTTGNVTHFVAEEDVTLIGVISLFLVNKIPSPHNLTGCWGYVTNAYVKPEYRNQGVGKRLLRSVENHARRNGFELLVIWPGDRSYPFYKRAGFKSEGREQDPLVFVL